MLEKTRGNGRGYPFNEIRRVQTHFSQRVRVTPPLFPSMGFCPRRGLFGNGDGRELGEDCYHWGFGCFRGVQTHFSHQIPTRSRHPSFISKYGFLSEAGTVWQRGRAGIGEDCYHWGFGYFCELKTHPSVLGLLENTLTRGGPGVVTCDGLKWKLNYT